MCRSEPHTAPMVTLISASPAPLIAGLGTSMTLTSPSPWKVRALMAGILRPSFLPGGQQLLQLLRVLDRIVRVVVVHERVHLLGRPLHLFDARHPLGQLLDFIVVTETKVRRGAFDVPRLVVATVKAD